MIAHQIVHVSYFFFANRVSDQINTDALENTTNRADVDWNLKQKSLA
jgi:hypothetical protein